MLLVPEFESFGHRHVLGGDVALLLREQIRFRSHGITISTVVQRTGHDPCLPGGRLGRGWEVLLTEGWLVFGTYLSADVPWRFILGLCCRVKVGLGRPPECMATLQPES